MLEKQNGQQKQELTIDGAEMELLHAATMNSLGILTLPSGMIMRAGKPSVTDQKALQKVLIDRSFELIDIEMGANAQGQLVLMRVFVITMLGRARLSQLRATAKGAEQ